MEVDHPVTRLPCLHYSIESKNMQYQIMKIMYKKEIKKYIKRMNPLLTGFLEDSIIEMKKPIKEDCYA